MNSVKAVLIKACDHFGVADEVVAPQVIKQTELPGGIDRLWNRYYTYSETAGKAIIGQTVMLAACHIRCLLDVNIVYINSCIYLTMAFQGCGDLIFPPFVAKNERQQMRVPLFLALASSPLVLLAGVQWHTKDINRATLIGVRCIYSFSCRKSADISNIALAMLGQ